MPGPGRPIKPLPQMSRRELAADFLLLTALGGGCLALFVAGAWEFATRPGQRWVAVIAAALAVVMVTRLASQWAMHVDEWRRRRARAEPGAAPDPGRMLAFWDSNLSPR